MFDTSPKPLKIKIRNGLFLYPSQISALQKELETLREETPARMVLLVDTSGQMVAMMGEQGNIDPVALGSLIAGDLAASQEIARITGEFQDFQLVLREGERTHIAISEAGPALIFMVLFGKDVPLGWARRLIQKSARDIGEIVAKPPAEEETQMHKPNFSDEGLPDLFTDALGEIWKG